MNEVRSLIGPYWFSYTEALLTSLVVGFAENYFAAFSLEKGLSPLQSGLLVSLPLLIAAFFQFLLQTKLKQKKSISQFVLQALGLQVFSLFILGLFSLVNFKALNQITMSFFSLQDYENTLTFSILFIAFSLYWLGHYSLQPAWNRWIADIIPFNEGQKYFSMRTRLSQVGILIGLFLGGYLLHLNQKVEISLLYAYLFLGCFLIKIIIIELFKKHPTLAQPLHLDLHHFKNLFQTNKKFFYRYAFFNLTLFLSAPFVSGYLLSIRGISYENFMWIMSGLFSGKILTTYVLNKFTQLTEDSHKLMMVGIFIAAPLPALWPFCATMNSMILLHLVSGMGWAAWEVGLSLHFFRQFKGERKIEVVSLYNYFGVITQVIGTLIGSFIFVYIINKNFDILFILAGIIRMFAVITFAQSKLTQTSESQV